MPGFSGYYRGVKIAGRTAAYFAPYSPRDVRGMTTERLHDIHFSESRRGAPASASNVDKVKKELARRGLSPERIAGEKRARASEVRDTGGINGATNERLHRMMGHAQARMRTATFQDDRQSALDVLVRSRKELLARGMSSAKIEEERLKHTPKDPGLFGRLAGHASEIFDRARAGLGRLAGRAAGTINAAVDKLNTRPGRAVPVPDAGSRGTENWSRRARINVPNRKPITYRAS